VTRWPCASNSRHSARPMNPVPPVMSMCMGTSGYRPTLNPNKQHDRA
jgi:hypothetical protein